MTREEALKAHERRPDLNLRELADVLSVNYNTLRRQISEARRAVAPAPDFSAYYPRPDVPLLIHCDNCIVTGDIQLPTTSGTWVELMCAVADTNLPRRGRRLGSAGDLLNNDAFSAYEPETETPSLTQEVAAVDAFLNYCFEYFDFIDWTAGNHERRAQKRTGNVLNYDLFTRMVLGHNQHRVRTSKLGYAYLHTSRDRWFLAHPRGYRKDALLLANELAQKEQSNIVCFHEHHLGVSYDRFKRYILINAGGLFERKAMSYAVLDPSPMPHMQNGFVMMRNGYPHLLGPDGFTDWSMWLGDEAVEVQDWRRAA